MALSNSSPFRPREFPDAKRPPGPTRPSCALISSCTHSKHSLASLVEEMSRSGASGLLRNVGCFQSIICDDLEERCWVRHLHPRVNGATSACRAMHHGLIVTPSPKAPCPFARPSGNIPSDCRRGILELVLTDYQTQQLRVDSEIVRGVTGRRSRGGIRLNHEPVATPYPEESTMTKT